jgi:hypothetical protein
MGPGMDLDRCHAGGRRLHAGRHRVPMSFSRGTAIALK